MGDILFFQETASYFDHFFKIYHFATFLLSQIKVVYLRYLFTLKPHPQSLSTGEGLKIELK
jgi:hypothetical protein